MSELNYGAVLFGAVNLLDQMRAVTYRQLKIYRVLLYIRYAYAIIADTPMIVSMRLSHAAKYKHRRRYKSNSLLQ